ncbi:MAG: type I-E CRISPR-associated protein Cse1/CasA [Candidatus Omnitrophica bacterium]|nr:type I-E CRISPR-associated protein Cse1/CasA [Candidatus Omnitrophota bacterium]
MNLIYDKWIPVRRKSGKKEKIAPWEVTKNMAADPILELAAPRPDFNGALIQFLIGLLQTTCAPNSNKEWRSWRDNPPVPEELKRKFEEVAFAFNLDGTGPRFMQDLTLESELKKTDEPESIDKLLIDSPGGQTEKFNTDHFIKRGRVEQLCFSCSAQALLTLQLNAPAGGAGHRVGLRGGGPVNTVILGNFLWETVWSNVLDQNRFNNLASPDQNENEDKFPWCGETRTSENDKVTTGQDVHPYQVYWSLPRRIRLGFNKEKNQCNLCGENDVVVNKYFTKPYGVMYKGIVHPLTPTYEKSDKKSGKVEVFSVHQHESVGYKSWLGYVQTIIEEKRRIAEVINQVFDRRIINFRIYAFGYDMDNMKASCWHEGIMPVVTIEDENKRHTYEAEIVSIIQAVNSIAVSLRYAVKDAWFDPQQKKNVDLGFVVQRFWQETEPDFYHHIAKLREDVMADGDGLAVKQGWHRCIVRKAEQIFNEVSQSEMIDEVNVRRVADSWNKLRRNIYGKKIKQDILGLPN